MSQNENFPEIPRMDVDVVCVGFGPAMAGFLTEMNRVLRANLDNEGRDGVPLPQIMCYERADDLSFGVSGVVTRAKGLKETLSEEEIRQMPMAAPVQQEKLVYLLDPVGASRRSGFLRVMDSGIRMISRLAGLNHQALELPWIPGFLQKHGGLVFPLGQFCQWAASKIMETGLIQIWPGMPAHRPILEGNFVRGIILMDQGTDRQGNRAEGFMPGMEVHAGLTVVGDGPCGSVGEEINRRTGVPENYSREEWAVGMKVVIDLPADCSLVPGTVLHTFGYPEPEIFGFMYVHPDGKASAGIFVPSWMENPVRTSYRYLQHWMLHPYLWRYFKGGSLRSWGAKSLQESGRRAEPHLVGDGYARIGEGSGTTNILTGSGVDEAWTSGVQLAQAVLKLWREKRPFTRENLESTYVEQRRNSWIETESRKAERSRDGFHRGIIWGLVGMGLSGLSGGRINLPIKAGKSRKPMSLKEYFQGRVDPAEIEQIRKDCESKGLSLHDRLMEKSGWPEIPYDGKLLVSHQDALLLGGKVQAPAGYADHVTFLYPNLCANCETRLCVEICSGQAIMPGPGGKPIFEREKCIHCGACFWSCPEDHPEDSRRRVLEFKAGTGGLHSAEN
ncbi:MAG TPA: 4Fe-4S binding protein [Candidatus Paceibacterota bacterium]|nr:4Fe-4S binding protein [Candidatus Paceibacterota bacterium]